VNLPVGVLGTHVRARFGFEAGGWVAHAPVAHAPITMNWWVGADDGWHDPAADTTTRYRRPGVAPSYETAVRIPSGDLVQRVYAVATPSGTGAIAIDFENASRAPCSVAVFVDVGAAGRLRLRDNELTLDETRLLTFARPPRLWASGADVHDIVQSGRASASGPPEWAAPSQVALLAPLPHRTVLRTALTREAVDVAALTDPGAVERGWRRQLDRGLRTDLPDSWQTQIDQRRADLLLASPSARVVAALEDWGFDAEALDMWSRLGWRARRAARRRVEVRGPWHRDPAPDAFFDPAVFLLAIRQLLVRDHRRTVDLLPGFRPEWLGQNLAVHDLPLRTGPLSYALRWHGSRPALLWDAPADVQLRVSVLDPNWQADGGAGETLLAAPPAALLAMGTSARSGTRVSDPGSFG
jgi:hypothetical protein